MPKQGQFARSSRIKHLNQFKVKSAKQRPVIDDQSFVDYLVLRFNLTSKRKLTKKIQESNQRFLMEIMDNRSERLLDLRVIIPPVLKRLNSRVPWQFYRQIIDGWEILQHFIHREVPKVPLEKPVLVSGVITREELTRMVAEELAIKATTMTFLKHSVPKSVQSLTQRRLFQTIYRNDQVNWQQIAVLFKPFPLVIDPQLDQGTKEWLKGLKGE